MRPPNKIYSDKYLCWFYLEGNYYRSGNSNHFQVEASWIKNIVEFKENDPKKFILTLDRLNEAIKLEQWEDELKSIISS